VLALGLATLAVAAAVVAAIGPAHHEHSLYRWPPAQLPHDTPTNAWFTPLLLSNRVPASIDVTLPCGEFRALRPAQPEMTILATARDPATAEGLALTHAAGMLDVSVGRHRLLGVSWPPSDGPCPFVVRIADGQASAAGRHVPVGTSYPGGMPSVAGLFSGLDVGSSPGFRVDVTTRTYATSPTPWQTTARVVAIALAAAALLLLLRAARREAPLRPIRAAGRVVAHGAWRERSAADLVVVITLLAWAVLAPAQYDDGWVWVRQTNFYDVGAFTNYFDGYGANLPLVYWLEWLEHWLAASDALIVMRIPIVVVLLATWPLARWCLRRAIGTRQSAPVLWTLAAAFLAYAMTWGMTLRPESIVAFLALTSLAGSLSFATTPRLAPLAVSAIASVLAASAHPAGLVAAAPLLAISPYVVRAVRSRDVPLGNLVTLFAASLGVGLVVLYLDTDLRAWLADRRLLEQSEYYSQTWWFELERYRRVFVDAGGPLLRPFTVLILLFAVVAYFARRRQATESTVLSIPARAVAIGLGLLLFTPSKSALHFGSLGAIGAVAVAAECWRLWTAKRRYGRLPLVPIVVVEVVIAGATWSWLRRRDNSAFELQATSWRDALGPQHLSGSALAPWLLAAAFVGGAAWLFLRRRRRSERAGSATDAPWRVAAWSLPAAVAVLTAATFGVLTYNAVAAAGWSLPKQNLAALAGRSGCGLGDSLTPAGGSAGPARVGAPTIANVVRRPGQSTLIEPNIATYFPCVEIPSTAYGVAQVPDLMVVWPVGRSADWPYPSRKQESSFGGLEDVFSVRLLAQASQGPRLYTIDTSVPGATAVAPTRIDQ
jgi:arabinosyltransferase B/arabinosyltransferase C